MKNILKVEKIEKYYGNKDNITKAIDNISFRVDKGEFVGVMGPSGSGKTTLLNCISTIDTVTTGNIIINDKDITKMKSKQLENFRKDELGFIFQDFNLLDTHTVYENIAMPLSLAKVSSKEIKERVQTIAQSMNIDHLLKKYPYQCSGGQKQRAAICRALIGNPKIIIADEPTGNLDSVNSQELLNILKQLNEEQKVTIIMVSHDAMIASYSSRLIYIKDGIIEQTLEKGQLTQEEYFQKIIELNSKEYQGLLKNKC